MCPPRPSPSHLQNSKGERARGPTKEEFRDFIEKVKQAWAQHREWQLPLWSWDNASIHGKLDTSDWEGRGVSSLTHTQLPPYSPDMHAAIEITHAQIMAHMQKFINQHRPQPTDTLQLYINQLKAIFAEHITPAFVSSLTHRVMLQTVPAILQANGGYPSKELR